MPLRAHPTASRGLGIKVEAVMFDVAKFLGLCAHANPNALEILFADEADWLYETPLWRRLHGERTRFLSRKVAETYVGYAVAQLRKIESHRAWLLDPPKARPERKDFGLPEEGTLARDDQHRIDQALADKVRSYGLDDEELSKPLRVALEDRLRRFWLDTAAARDDDLEERMRAVASHALGLPLGVTQTLVAERRYRAAMKHWDAYRTWKAQRNPARAALEARHGYDTKHAMHLVRLMRTGIDLLETGELRVRRADAEELIAIRNGALPFDALVQMAASLRRTMDDAAAATSLPPDVDARFVDGLLAEVIERAHRST